MRTDVYKKLDAQRREVGRDFVWRAAFRRVVKPAKNINDDKDEDLWFFLL
jgi:hypothetical protein